MIGAREIFWWLVRLDELPARRRKVERPQVVFEEPRRLTDADIDSFLFAASQRPPDPGMKADEFLDLMFVRHPRRMARFNKDYQWLRDQAARKGIAPEQVPWLL